MKTSNKIPTKCSHCVMTKNTDSGILCKYYGKQVADLTGETCWSFEQRKNTSILDKISTVMVEIGSISLDIECAKLEKENARQVYNSLQERITELETICTKMDNEFKFISRINPYSGR